ncbi:MAG: response regulator transcription factor [Kiritimatiellae bacterium]|nr:response regulator transcription factor [Kiritimatiellia bacterium]
MNNLANILIVEDDSTIRTILQMLLRSVGFTHVRSAARGDEGLDAIRREPPQLVLLDLMLPGLDGLTVCRRVREDPTLADVRIIMLTAKSEDEDVVRGLELGADDYVTKPFSREVLLARINAVLRRNDPLAAGRDLDGLRIDSRAGSATLNGELLTLTRGEFRLVALLASRPGRVYTRSQIIDAVQDEEKSVTERTVDVQLVGLRKKLGDWASHIETIRGVGYRVKP